ncbi:MAG: response regulator, partial [Cytophagaceae bacterium]
MAKLLIVDDEKAIRAALRDILEYEGYEIDEARDGE